MKSKCCRNSLAFKESNFDHTKAIENLRHDRLVPIDAYVRFGKFSYQYIASGSGRERMGTMIHALIYCLATIGAETVFSVNMFSLVVLLGLSHTLAGYVVLGEFVGAVSFFLVPESLYFHLSRPYPGRKAKLRIGPRSYTLCYSSISFGILCDVDDGTRHVLVNPPNITNRTSLDEINGHYTLRHSSVIPFNAPLHVEWFLWEFIALLMPILAIAFVVNEAEARLPIMVGFILGPVLRLIFDGILFHVSHVATINRPLIYMEDEKCRLQLHTVKKLCLVLISHHLHPMDSINTALVVGTQPETIESPTAESFDSSPDVHSSMSKKLNFTSLRSLSRRHPFFVTDPIHRLVTPANGSPIVVILSDSTGDIMKSSRVQDDNIHLSSALPG